MCRDWWCRDWDLVEVLGGVGRGERAQDGQKETEGVAGQEKQVIISVPVSMWALHLEQDIGARERVGVHGWPLGQS